MNRKHAINGNDGERDMFDECQREPLHVRLTRRTTVAPVHEPVGRTALFAGLAAGVAQAGVFNPYDRALYLSVTHTRPFLHRENWKSPYTGFFQSIGGRALSGGLYFPLEHLFLRCFKQENDRHSPAFHLLAGTTAGATNAMVLNPITAVKYKTWGREVNRGMLTEAFGMIQKSGSLRPFANGLLPTVYRDVVFGGCYTWLRLQLQWTLDLQPHEQWYGNIVAAGMATVISGPFNYVRNIQYSTSSQVKADSTVQILVFLIDEIKEAPSVPQKLSLIQNRLRIGWGTARVALGMTFAHGVYDWFHEDLLRSDSKR